MTARIVLSYGSEFSKAVNVYTSRTTNSKGVLHITLRAMCWERLGKGVVPGGVPTDLGLAKLVGRNTASGLTPSDATKAKQWILKAWML